MKTITHHFLRPILKRGLPAVAAGTFLLGVTADQSSRITPALLLASIPHTVEIEMPEQAGPSPFHFICNWVALAGMHSEVAAAGSDFLRDIGKCINEQGGFPECLPEHEQQLEEARTLAFDQMRAKLDVCFLVGCGGYDPEIDPDDFSATVDNPYFPLVPGRTLVYESMTDEGLEVIEVTTLEETIEIEGIECVQVNDVVSLDGEVIEDTIDWYAQDSEGNVWYMGEIARNFEDGFLEDLDGSWRHGKDGGKPGILMMAAPSAGDAYRQEFLLNEAEDLGVVLALGQTVAVPHGTFTDCLQTEDFTPLEPDVKEHKYYAPGIGTVLELDPETGTKVELVNIIDP